MSRYPDPSLLPPDLATAIGEFEGLVRVEPDPQVTVPAAREVQSHYYGIACPDCHAETGWDYFEWVVFHVGPR